MAQTREIKGRIKAVGNIQRITKTMQMIATARFQSMQKKATDAQAYTRKIREIVGELSASLGEESSISHPLLRAPSPPVGREKLLVLTSNRGLCGAYNANIMRTALEHIRSIGQDQLDIEVVGKKGLSILRFNGVRVNHHHGHFGDNPSFTDVHALAQQYMDAFVAGEYDAVRVCYMAFHSMSKQQPELMQLLPLQQEGPRGQGDEGPSENQDSEHSAPGSLGPSAPSYDFSPDPQTLLAELLPISVKQALYQAFNEAVVSEQLARMVAMKAATDAAGKQQKALKRQYNRARQAAITTEISEIVSGAAALE
ncbi:MAG: ATP synthase F1 subunit gamma [Phycisphaeraceae bacterium]